MKTLGIIGAGAFGALAVAHLRPFFTIRIFDAKKDAQDVTRETGLVPASFEACAACDVVLLCVPVQETLTVANKLVNCLKPAALVIDVASVKVKPAAILATVLPDDVNIVCTHPLFGPQSAKNGLIGHKISVCHVRGDHTGSVIGFLRDCLSLTVIETTPEEHDRELAYVQGLTHLVAKLFTSMRLESFQQTTKSFELLMEAISLVRFDSEELFAAIERENPYAAEARERFFAAAQALASRINGLSS